MAILAIYPVHHITREFMQLQTKQIKLLLNRLKLNTICVRMDLSPYAKQQKQTFCLRLTCFHLQLGLTFADFIAHEAPNYAAVILK